MLNIYCFQEVQPNAKFVAEKEEGEEGDGNVQSDFIGNCWLVAGEDILLHHKRHFKNVAPPWQSFDTKSYFGGFGFK